MQSSTINKLIKLAASLSDQQLDQIIDTSADTIANKYKGFGSSLINPIKKRIINYKLNRDNVKSGIRNLYSAAKDNLSEAMADELSRIYNKQFYIQNPTLMDKLKFVGGALSQATGIGDGGEKDFTNPYRKFNAQFVNVATKSYSRALANRLQFAFKDFKNNGKPKKLLTLLNSGEFNNADNADTLIKDFIRQYSVNNILPSHVKSDSKGLLGTLANYKIKGELAKGLNNAETRIMRILNKD